MTEKYIPPDGPENAEVGPESVKKDEVVSEIRQNLAGLGDKPAKSVPKSELLTFRELTSEKIREISDFFRLMFNNYWPEFAVCPPCDHSRPEGMRISAFDVYGKQDQPIPLGVMDADHPMPDCPCCGGKMKVFHDPKTVHENIKGKLGRDGYVSLLRDSDSDAINGFAFGYGCTLEEEFQYEWKNPYHYMADPPKEYDRSFENLLTCLNKTFPGQVFRPDSEVFCWNCIATIPGIRGPGLTNVNNLLESFFRQIPHEKYDHFIVGEAERNSTAEKMFKMLGAEEVPGAFEKEKMMVAGKVSLGLSNLDKISRRFSRLPKRSGDV